MRVLSFFKYLILFVFFYAAFLVYFLPAAFIWNYAEPYARPLLRQSQVQVQGVAGTIWQGQVSLEVQGIPLLTSWRLDAGRLVEGMMGVNLHLLSSIGELEASGFSGMQERFVQIERGEVNLKMLNPLLKRKKVRLDGLVNIKSVRLALRDKQIIDSIGKVIWTGGAIEYPAGREMHERVMPAFEANIVWREPNVHIGVRDQDATFDVIEGELDQSGWLKINAKKRLLDIADERWPQSTPEDQSIFSVRQRILNL